MTIHSSGQTIFSFTHIESITQDASEEVDEADGGASGMDRIDEVDGWASEEQAAGGIRKRGLWQE